MGRTKPVVKPCKWGLIWRDPQTGRHQIALREYTKGGHTYLKPHGSQDGQDGDPRNVVPLPDKAAGPLGRDHACITSQPDLTALVLYAQQYGEVLGVPAGTKIRFWNGYTAADTGYYTLAQAVQWPILFRDPQTGRHLCAVSSYRLSAEPDAPERLRLWGTMSADSKDPAQVVNAPDQVAGTFTADHACKPDQGDYTALVEYAALFGPLFNLKEGTPINAWDGTAIKPTGTLVYPLGGGPRK